MEFVYCDGGRFEAGYIGNTGDCTCRAIAIAAGLSYQVVYDALNAIAKTECNPRGRKSSARIGVSRKVYQTYLESIGWTWHPTMFIGQGCKVHLTDGELPTGRLIVRVSKHHTAVIDGTIYDTYDPQRHTMITEDYVTRFVHRCVYGYWTRAVNQGAV